jgi:hypothetical protein
MFGQACGDCRQLFCLLAGHGCGLHPAFPAPSVLQEDATDARLGRNRAAGTLKHVARIQRHCERSEAIQNLATEEVWIASAHGANDEIGWSAVAPGNTPAVVSDKLAGRASARAPSADPGPITTGSHWDEAICNCHLAQRLRPVVMGPRSNAQFAHKAGTTDLSSLRGAMRRLVRRNSECEGGSNPESRVGLWIASLRSQ